MDEESTQKQFRTSLWLWLRPRWACHIDCSKSHATNCSRTIWRLTELPTAPIELLDSKLEYNQSKGKMRLLYNPKNGDKVVLDQMYFELIDEPANHRFFTNEQGNMVYVTNSKGNYVYAVMAPMRIPDNELDHFEFVVAES